MKFLHISDSHLGYSAYRKATPDGINQREIDTYFAFEKFVDFALKSKPDLILHAGDLFDSVRPNNRAITFAVDQILKISKEKIPFVIIAGNHEHPKLKETGHIFSIFNHMENIYPVYNAKYETISFNIKNKKVAVHAVPQCELKKQFEIELGKIKPDSSAEFNIFLSHGAVSGIQEFSMNEFNELIIPAKTLSNDFDYIALGHYHKFTKLANNAYYSGSTERFSYTEAQDKKGFLEIDLSQKNLKSNFIKLEIRQMIDSKPIKCTNLKLEEIMKKIKETLKEINPKEKIFRITLNDIPSQIYRNLDFNDIKKISNESIHFEIKANVDKNGESSFSKTSKIDALTFEFKQFIESQDLTEKDTLLELGIGYIDKIEAREEGK
ncbi:MAG: DNA repair exonuclease [Thermoplasmatales archaeon SG8-52-3]|nr:MAG: DNA repair exonuclease [Thermoplasmatales archaeon SG8-52-3]